ncbi:site-specific integrase [Massilia aurea]|uniref:site-specific integrase n=1 Tax=Massilia aurea TaxID=373040 RepID=UPI000F2DE670|nr:site-specific integrase [Massilia aurea]
MTDERPAEKPTRQNWPTRAYPSTLGRKIIATICNRARRDKPDNWQATVRIGKISRSKTFESREDAEKFAQALETKMRKDLAKQLKADEQSRAKEPTLFDYINKPLNEALTSYRNSPECTQHHRENMTTVFKFLDDAKIGDITPKWVKSYIARVAKTTVRGKSTTYSYGTIAKHLAILSVACQWLAEQYELPPQPSFFSTKYFPANWDNCRTRRLSSDEQKKLELELESIDSESSAQWSSLLHLALETGARLQELAGATQNEVDLERKIWTLPAARTKSKKTRVIPLSKVAQFHFERLAQDLRAPSDRFFHRLGTPSSVSCGFRRYADRAGLVDYRFHDLRHEAISRMVLYKRKLSVFEIMAIVGHSSTKMLMRYANLRGEELVDRMD